MRVGKSVTMLSMPSVCRCFCTMPTSSAGPSGGGLAPHRIVRVPSTRCTALVHAPATLASRAGADWVIPFDADEFWFARDETVAAYLRRIAMESPDAGIVSAAFHHMVPVSDAPHDWPETEFVLDSTPAVPGVLPPLATLGTKTRLGVFESLGSGPAGLPADRNGTSSPARRSRE